jgi:hypothetical protein
MNYLIKRGREISSLYNISLAYTSASFTSNSASLSNISSVSTQDKVSLVSNTRIYSGIIPKEHGKSLNVGLHKAVAVKFLIRGYTET